VFGSRRLPVDRLAALVGVDEGGPVGLQEEEAVAGTEIGGGPPLTVTGTRTWLRLKKGARGIESVARSIVYN
jgi:hypothetical protein